MRKIYFKKLMISFIVCYLPAILGFFLMNSTDTWYDSLNKPWFTPPNWVFGPVWTILYFLMAISLYLVWTSNKNTFHKTRAISVFFIQLVLNGLWTPVFFAGQAIAPGLIIILFLDISVLYTIKLFYDFKKEAAYLLMPYFGWSFIATLLNVAIVYLN